MSGTYGTEVVETPGVGLRLPAKPENVALVRHALAGLAAALGAEEGTIADLKTVVTEACMNVCLHAYAGEDGPLEVRAWGEGGSIHVRIRDQGAGIRPVADDGRKSLRLGLPLIAALTSDFEIRRSPDGGTEVGLTLPLVPSPADAEDPTPPTAPTATEIDVPAGEFVGPILSRVVSMTATKANFSIDRLSDAVLLSDALSTHAPDSYLGGMARISISQDESQFELQIGPLVAGSGGTLVERLAIPGVGMSLAALADEVAVESDGEADYVRVTLSGS
ncbi:ATP-binding protein [Thermoleophilia bacterium SCSIO 60948]|nr:ATP-binding protein [Thermoleophilia bacterium SCSIO 60948]